MRLSLPLKAIAALLAALLLGCVSCSLFRLGGSTSAWPPGVEAALRKSGANACELRRVLQHYRAQDDSLKFQATCYLIENMEGHSYAILSLCDSAEADVELNVLDYPDYKTLMATVEEIEAERGELDYHRKEIRNDLETMPADLLIEHIDLAFHAWRDLPWAQHLSSDDFLAYVLPYRGSNEPLESWRPHFLARYADLATEMTDPTDPIEAAKLINGDLIEWFKFDPRFYLHPTDQGLAEMLKNRMGRCEDMTNLAIYAMRANGLAVTSDYTPHWANAGNNHAWNAILDRDGEVIIFMGAEAHPTEYALSNKLAKVYRKTYAWQPDNLVFQKEEWEQVPGWLKGKNYVDVTSDYQEVIDVTVGLEEPTPDSVAFAYLCVFNSGKWKAIHWGRIEDGHSTFTDMGKDIVYLPAYFVRKELLPAASPFILHQNGEITSLVPQEQDTMTLRVTSTTGRAKAASTDGIRKSLLESGKTYEIFCWKGEWISAGKTMAGEEPLAFAGLPGGALYWMVAEGSRKDERIFTYEGKNQVWW